MYPDHGVDTRDRQGKLSDMTDHINTPLDAALLAGDIEARISRLSTLDLHPVTNAADIERERVDAIAAVGALLAYLVTSDDFTPVTEADDAVQEWEL